ncbi:hypothetical protein KUV61_05880 [Nocardioides marinus]|uniref:hypothetical protein n=1 Tax=Leisingera sp. TaxID=1879318 RepID=UPI001C95F08B|nr:hypothetical protein [Nocardioides marinus]
MSNDDTKMQLEALEAEAARNRVALEQSISRLTQSLSPAQAAAAVKEAGHEAAGQALDLVQRNAGDLAWVGTGAAMLLSAANRKSTPPSGKRRARAPSRAARYVALGGAAFGLGALAAALMPRTRQEEQLVSSLSDAVTETARTVAARTAQYVPPHDGSSDL